MRLRNDGVQREKSCGHPRCIGVRMTVVPKEESEVENHSAEKNVLTFIIGGSFPIRSFGKEREELCRSAVLWVSNTVRLYGISNRQMDCRLVCANGLVMGEGTGCSEAKDLLSRRREAYKKTFWGALIRCDRKQRRERETVCSSYPASPHDGPRVETFPPSGVSSRTRRGGRGGGTF